MNITVIYFTDSCTECSPVNHTGILLDSQFSTTSPMAAWMPPSLGRRYVKFTL